MLELLVLTIREHPLIAAWLVLLFVFVLIHGVLDVCRIFVRLVIVILQEMKHQISGLGAALRDLLRELRSWKSDP